MSRRALAAAPAAALACLLAAPAAHATTFCVNTPPGCTGTAVTSAGLDGVFDTPQVFADGEPDRVEIDAGSYTTADGMYIAPGDPLTIVGTADTPPVISTSSASDLTIVRTSFAAAPVRLEHLVVQVPASMPDGDGTAISPGDDTTLDDVFALGSNEGAIAVEVPFGRTSRLHDVLAAAPGGTALMVRGTARVTDSTLSGAIGAELNADTTLEVDRSVIAATAGGTFARGIRNRGGSATLRDTLIRVATDGNDSADGIETQGMAGEPASTVADHVTLVRTGAEDTDTVGLDTNAAGAAGSEATLTFTNGIVHGFEAPGIRFGQPASRGDVTLRHAIVGPFTADAGNGALVRQDVLDADPLFTDGSNHRLGAGSPAIDAGDPAFPLGGTDREGRPRVMDGNLDGVYRTDLGASEVLGPVPPPPGIPGTPPVAQPPAPGPLVVTPARDARRPRARFRSPKAVVRRGTKVRFAGTAIDEGGVARVEVAVVRLVGGARAAARSCRRVDARGRLKRLAAKRGRCVPAGWLRAKGTTAWSLTLPRALPRGTYAAYVRATDAAGNRSTPVRLRFRVR